jgi:hypothetical protein
MQDKILQDAKRRAVAENMSLTAFIEEAVREKLAYPSAKRNEADTQPFNLITFNGNGTYSDIELDKSAALRDVMDE